MSADEDARPVPKLSVVVVIHDMAREAPRTLLSLAVPYQRGVDPRDYEVLVIDNGSRPRFDEAQVHSHGSGFRYFYLENASSSPVGALNFGVEKARGAHLGLLIDGARLVTPGLLALAVEALQSLRLPILATLSFFLGPVPQYRAAEVGYDCEAEDRLLEGIGWPSDGYRLFEVSVLSDSSRHGWFGCPYESNCLFLPTALYQQIGGFDPAFDLPGGGLANLDFWLRCCDREDATVALLLGEGTFHQTHGGIATNAPGEIELASRLRAWTEQYRSIRGRDLPQPDRRLLQIGRLPAAGGLPEVTRSRVSS